jgi:hypothetical protein
MRQLVVVSGGLTLMLAMTCASAKDYPLQYREIKSGDVMQFPGGYGASSSLTKQKPSGLSRAPAAASKTPLYGSLHGSGSGEGRVFRLDESKGSGRGYDRLLIDINNNGDLTDETVILPAKNQPDSRSSTETERKMFGPVATPRIGAWQPLYYVDIYVYRRQLESEERGNFLGYSRLKPAWYLETKVSAGKKTQKMGLIDANADFVLGKTGKFQEFTQEGKDRWYWQQGDAFLLDTDNSGVFTRERFDEEACSFSEIVYFGAVPFKATVDAELSKLTLVDWPGRLAELDFGRESAQVESIDLAWESKPGTWQMLEPGIANGKAQVPPGKYRLIACMLQANAGKSDELLLMGHNNDKQAPLQLEAGSGGTMILGGPLEIKVSARPQGTVRREGYTLSINAQVVGKGGEIYSGFYAGKELKTPGKPSFTVVGEDGSEYLTGTLEYG